MKYAIGSSLTTLIILVALRAGFAFIETQHVSVLFMIDILSVLSAAIWISLSLYCVIVKRYPDTRDLLHVFCIILIVIILLGYTILRYLPNYQISLSIMVTGILVGMGWWIQAINTANNTRRSHTLNIILNTRISQEYQDHLKASTRLIPEGKFLAHDLAIWRCARDREEYKLLELDPELRKALDGLLFTLNYFEFLAQGIRYKDLDEVLLRQCFSGFLNSLEKRGFYLILESQKINPDYFEGVVELSKRWNKESIIDKYRSTPSNAEIGTQFPCEDDMTRILKGEERQAVKEKNKKEQDHKRRWFKTTKPSP